MLLDLGLPPAARRRGPATAWRAARLRARHDATPVIVLTARDALGDRVAGLDAGADDYLVKPFELDELTARMRAVLRRHAGRGEPVLVARRRARSTRRRAPVTLHGAPVPLSAREFAVLEALMARPGALLSRAQLEDRLYGWGEEIESNAVSVYVHQLRRKLGADVIRTVRGVGYFMRAGADGAARRAETVGRAPRLLRCRLLVSLLALLALAALRHRRGRLPQRARRDRGAVRLPAAGRWRCRCATRARSRRRRPARWPTQQLDFVVQIWSVDGRSIYASRAHPALPSRACSAWPTWRSAARPGAPTASPRASG